MATTTARNSERLELRLPAEVKELAQTAAELSGQTLTSFVLDAVRRSAATAIHEHQQIKLTLDQWEQFNQILTNPPKLTDKFRRAVQRWKELELKHQQHADHGDPGSASER